MRDLISDIGSVNLMDKNKSQSPGPRYSIASKKKVLAAMGDKLKTSYDIAEGAGLSASHTRDILSQLKKMGCVEQVIYVRTERTKRYTGWKKLKELED